MSELPADIAKAIRKLELEAICLRGIGFPEEGETDAFLAARAALEAVILKHLGRSALSETVGEGK